MILPVEIGTKTNTKRGAWRNSASLLNPYCTDREQRIGDCCMRRVMQSKKEEAAAAKNNRTGDCRLMTAMQYPLKMLAIGC